MHTFLYRTNALATFASTVLSVICMLATSTDYFHTAQPEISLKLAKTERMFKSDYGNDEAHLALSLDADLRPLFSWNTKQLFVFVQAEYTTQKNVLNQVSLWDRIIEEPEDAVLHMPYMRNKYKLVDQGHNLRGRMVNLTFVWNVMPISGVIYTQQKVFPNIQLPADYVGQGAGRGRRYQGG
mmetsp:Transcript_12053/g.38183  ORF Transcript_12053/g.38183 Transcript_12053/m.38183 type:complete len:182 (+) Transcript_12053:295-840(+)|eukprot:CAMPEP_0182909308 /NCGR_PEP_ID=MMETSP0034_2-20130328/35681_1 /TAXON_ID=156128 /ORGANISM="Nephroselmis pyriformis, Strain CCMP717" /LENGTH=181 /DNA_ID=CAMNT_0025045553 /DNA_START=170 /DNA_END=715 /DNA_ORIENTATION=+